ncbi:MFS transporter [Vulcanisaeta thermophila]|uniref:MFS transporter n=1 Tax=Vulcanisaeta thermophila TaxID=867917 RepID=UPI000853C306|nr:MFS transporter [Vulcanisaeta thermophila]
MSDRELKAGELRARIDRLPIRPYPVSWMVIIGLGYFFAFYDILILSFSFVSPMVTQLRLSRLNLSEIASASLIGYIIGAYFVSTVSDYFGRRWGLITNAILIAIGSIGCALAGNFYVLITSRFIAGMGIGAEIAVINTYISEITPAGIRGKMVQLTYLAGALGFAVTPFIALALIPLSPVGWRWMFGISAVVAFTVFPLRTLLPESPRWLVIRGRFNEAEAVVKRLEEYVARKIGTLPPTPAPLPENFLKKFPTAELFNRQYLPRLIMAIAFWFFDYMLAYGVIGFAPYILIPAGFTFTSATWYIALGSIGYIVGALSMAPLADRWERKYLVASAFSIATLAVFLYALAVYLLSPVVLTIGAFLGAFATAFAVPAYTYTAELFPTRARATGFALADGIGHLGGAVVPFLIYLVFDPAKPVTTGIYTFVMLGIFEIIATAIVLTGPRTTKLRLEEISK